MGVHAPTVAPIVVPPSPSRLGLVVPALCRSAPLDSDRVHGGTETGGIHLVQQGLRVSGWDQERGMVDATQPIWGRQNPGRVGGDQFFNLNI